jgi:glycosyltransferase involved in cell wall biosynthesis
MNAIPQNTYAVGTSVVVPVYQSSETLLELCSRIGTCLAESNYEVILVDDGSRPETWETIQNLSREDQRIIGIRLSRNYGQHSALLAGIRIAKYEFTVTIDDDLQNPPEEISRLLDELKEKDLDIVYGQPQVVRDNATRRIGGKGIRLVMRILLGVRDAAATSSFRAFRTRLRDAFWEDLGPNISIDALLSWASLNSGSISVMHNQRKVGKSNYSFRKLLRFSSDTITGYGIVPLQVATGIGFLTIVLGILLLCFLVLQRLLVGSSAPGFTLLASLITIFAGIQLMILGLIGEYLGRMHYRIMRKPTYVVRETTRTHNS